jgi:hypothetical protein
MEHQTLAIIVSGLGFILFCFIFFGFIGAVTRRAIRRGDPEIHKRGISAQAQILRTWDTGVRIGDMNVLVGMELQVHPPSGSPYRTKTKAFIPVVNMAQFQPGVMVPIKIHPTKPNKVHLDIYESGTGRVQVVDAEALGIDKEALAAQLRARLDGAAPAEPKTLSQRLEEVEQARSAGLLTDDEYERKRKEIIDAA